MKKAMYCLLIICLPLQLMAQQVTPAMEQYIQQYFTDIAKMDVEILKKYIPDESILTESYFKNYTDYLDEQMPAKLKTSVRKAAISHLEYNFLFQILDVYFKTPDNETFWQSVEIIGFYELLIDLEVDIFTTERTEKFGILVLLKNKNSNAYYTATIDRLFLKNNILQGGVIEKLEPYDLKNKADVLNTWRTSIQKEIDEIMSIDGRSLLHTQIEESKVSTDEVKDMAAEEIPGDTVRFKGVINRTTYVFDIIYSLSETLNDDAYVMWIIIEKDGVRNESIYDVSILSQPDPICIFREDNPTIVYHLKIVNEQQIKIAIINEEGISSGFVSFEKQ